MAPLYSFISIELSVAGLLKLERGISKVSKMGLLIAIGCLAKRPVHKVFKDGICQCQDNKQNERKYGEIHLIYIIYIFDNKNYW